VTATTDWNAKTIADLAPCSSKPSGVELRGLEPLTPSLRTRGMAVDRARLSTDLGVRRQRSPVEANGVAVLRCCTSRALRTERPDLPSPRYMSKS
jgi:hypothetical protein